MKLHLKKILPVFIVFCAIALPSVVDAKSIEELREELKEKRSSLKETESKVKKFKADIQEKKQEARTLADQITIIDDSIEEMTLDIERTEAEIDETDVEIESVVKEVEIKEQEMGHQKDVLASFIREMHKLDQPSSVAVFIKYGTFSEAMNESSTLAELQNRAQKTLVAIQQLHEELVTKKRELDDFKQTLEALRVRQQSQQDTLDSQRESKNRILDLTNAQESKYKEYLAEAQKTHQTAQASIKTLDAAIRAELQRQGKGALPSVGQLSWPVNPTFGVSCEFHCSGYPYAYLIGPHTGTDIPTGVGTPVRAAADGYVARVHDSGGSGYSYLMLIHGDNITTVYGHLSGFAINEDQLITRGTVIGYSGGAPGMRGSGLSTGAHLHFEVREKSVPINARKYLGPE